LKVYEYSLSIAFFVLFGLSMWLHAAGGLRNVNEENIRHGGPP